MLPQPTLMQVVHDRPVCETPQPDVGSLLVNHIFGWSLAVLGQTVTIFHFTLCSTRTVEATGKKRYAVSVIDVEHQLHNHDIGGFSIGDTPDLHDCHPHRFG